VAIDDDPATREIVSLMLDDAGYEVETTSNGREALALLRRRPADVIVLDLVMPDMDGPSFVTELRRVGTADTPVLLLSAANDVDGHAARLGVHGALSKPFDLDELVDRVDGLRTTPEAYRP
jgi:two-component system response regulator PrrA